MEQAGNNISHSLSVKKLSASRLAWVRKILRCNNLFFLKDIAAVAGHSDQTGVVFSAPQRCVAQGGRAVAGLWGASAFPISGGN